MPSEVHPDQQVQLFLRAVGDGRIDEVRRQLTDTPWLVNAVGPHPYWGGRPQALHVAIETKRPDLFHLLLEAGADVHGTNGEYEHWSPLMLAIQREQAEMRDELLRRGARRGLAEALLMADDASVADHLSHGSLPEPVPSSGSWLNFARTLLAIDRLLECGADLNAKDRWGTPPISALAQRGEAGQPLVRCLIERGATAMPEQYASSGDQAALAALIEANPALIQDAEVIIAAVEGRHHQMVQWLLAQGASANSATAGRSRQTLLHSAAWNGDLTMVKLLVSAGADIAALDGEHQTTPLGWVETAIGLTNNPDCRLVVEYLQELGATGQ
jgi:ankyrin repeat protein